MSPRRFALVGLLLALWALPGAAQAPAAVPPAGGYVVVLVPLGPVRPELLERVSQELQARLDVRIRVDPPRELPPEAWHAPRRRWRAERLLKALETQPPEGAWKVVAVTEAEISTTKGKVADWGIAGLGLIGGRSCVVSAYLYKKHSRTRAALLRRVGDLAVHEFGHTLGMEHCEVPGCVMSDAKGKAIQSADQSSGRFCEQSLEAVSDEVRSLVR